MYSRFTHDRESRSSSFRGRSSRGGGRSHGSLIGGRGRGRTGHGAGFRRDHIGSPSLLVPKLSALIATEALDDDERTLVAVEVHHEAPPLDKIPDIYVTPNQYLISMQRHTEAEYYAAIIQGARGREGWMEFDFDSDDKGTFLRVVGADFDLESWSKSLVQVEGHDTALFVTFCEKLPPLQLDDGEESIPQGKIKIRGIRKIVEGVGSGRVRLLSYIGSYLLEYSSALLVMSNTLPPGSSQGSLIKMVSSPNGDRPLAQDTLRSGRVMPNAPVPTNLDQSQAVNGLRPGLDIIHGPPGSGKSTTIWHIINSRLADDKRCWVTCSRNQAVDAIAGKVSSFPCLVFGNEKRLGSDAKKLTMNGQLERDPGLLRLTRIDQRVNILYNDAKRISSFAQWWGERSKMYQGCLKRFERRDVEYLNKKHEEENRKIRGATTPMISSKLDPKPSRAPGLWLLAIKAAFQSLFEKKLEINDGKKLGKWEKLLKRCSSLLIDLLPAAKMLRQRQIAQVRCII